MQDGMEPHNKTQTFQVEHIFVIGRPADLETQDEVELRDGHVIGEQYIQTCNAVHANGLVVVSIL